jgi:hypothetical protein
MLPALYDLLIDHKAEFGYGAHDPVFATRNGRRNTVDNVRRTIGDASVERANELLAARGQREIRAVHAAHAAAHVRLDPGRTQPAAAAGDVSHRPH